jgi:hypothetical protein
MVVDRNWITSRKPDDVKRFSGAIVKHLEREGAAAGPARNEESTARP